MVKCSVRLKLEWNCSMKWMILLLRNAIHRKSPQHTDRRGNASLEENHSEALDVGCRHKVERQGNSPPEENTTPSDNTKMRSPSLTEAAGVVVVVGSEKIVRRNGKGASACGEETRTVPFREEILKALLNCDIIDFHTFDYAHHFLSCCSRILGIEYQSKRGYIGLDYFGRTIGIKILPVGIHMGQLQSVLHLPDK
ncbi:hypothetical protein ZIOFF_046374 [Zingiber officinale]|uniref:Uncharacterized protein n=1 Tax=Zingiber officinale TaxID=94328 RepID=A0A8J5L2K2_ZINOF|nr:hypothetical protein ZIOFF_046374 [Zingiber officinale]